MSDHATTNTATPDAPDAPEAPEAPAAPAAGEAPANTPPERRPDAKPVEPQRLPPYHVILLNDDDHTYPYVIELLMKVFGYSPEKAYQFTKKVDEQDRATVWTGQKELAELKRDQVRDYGPDIYAAHEVTYPLGVTIEPAE